MFVNVISLECPEAAPLLYSNFAPERLLFFASGLVRCRGLLSVLYFERREFVMIGGFFRCAFLDSLG